MIASRTGRCIVVDLDDTLYDEIDFVRSGYEAVAELVRLRFGIDCGDTLRARLAARRLEGAFQEVAAGAGLPPEAVALMVERYRTHRPAIRPHPGVKDALEEAWQRDGVVGCITDGRGSTQRNKIAALGLERILDPVLISEETGHGKPDAHNFRELMRLVRAETYWYLADNPAKDFVAPNALGWMTVGVDTPGGLHRGASPTPDTHRPRHQLPLDQALALLRSPVT